MKRHLTKIALVAILTLFAACEAKIDTGPYLLLNEDGARVVRVQTSRNPLYLEYELQNKKTASGAMRSAGHNLYELPLPKRAVRYRVHVGERKTKWYELAPMAGKDVLRLVAYGDPRVGRGNPVARDRINDQIFTEKPSLVIASGDLVAWGGQEGLWQDLVENLEPIVSRLPYVATIGNHDVSDDHLFNRFFRAKGEKNYMSMPLGKGKLILLDSNAIQHREDEQYKFLEKELADANKAWPLVVAFHHPPFNFGHHEPRQDIRDVWVPLLQKYAVDLVLLGHDHDYQRIGPIGNVLYIITGGGGAPLVRVPSEMDPNLKAWAETNHYVVLDVKKDGITGTVKDENGEVVDTFSVNR